MIINSYIYRVATSYDTDAQLFFNAQTAAGVTLTTTQMNAVNQWVVDAKAAGIWTKMKAVYPIVGGTATSHKFNLKNPLDTDAAFRLVFAGGITHSSSGILGNGTNGIVNTFLNPTITLAQLNCHVSANIYSPTFGTDQTKPHIMSDDYTYIGLSAANQSQERSIMGSVYATATVTPSTHKGFWCTSRSSSAANGVNYLKADGSISNYTSSSNFTSVNIRLLGSTIFGYSNLGYSFFTIGNALTNTESLALKTAQANFQTALGRA